MVGDLWGVDCNADFVCRESLERGWASGGKRKDGMSIHKLYSRPLSFFVLVNIWTGLDEIVVVDLLFHGAYSREQLKACKQCAGDGGLGQIE